MSKKRNRNKPLFPRRFASDFVNTNRGLDQNRIQAYELLNNKQRVRTTKGARNNVEPVLENTYTREIPKTVSKQKYYGVSESSAQYTEGEDGTRRRIIPIETKEEQEFREEGTNKEWLPTPRGAAVKKMSKFTERSLYSVWRGNLRGSGVVEYNCIVLESYGDDFRVLMFFAGTEWLFVQETGSVRFISKTYSSRDEAMSYFQQKRISWIISEPM